MTAILILTWGALIVASYQGALMVLNKTDNL